MAARTSPEDARIWFWAGGAPAHRFLSNHYPSPFTIDAVTYATVEHWYQSSKVLDPEERRRVIEAPTPLAAKERVKEVTIRSDWDDLKLDVMKRGAMEKFRQNRDLAERLVATGDAELVHHSDWSDVFWAVDRKHGGLNHMGRILMELRDHFREARETPPGRPGERSSPHAPARRTRRSVETEGRRSRPRRTRK